MRQLHEIGSRPGRGDGRFRGRRRFTAHAVKIGLLIERRRRTQRFTGSIFDPDHRAHMRVNHQPHRFARQRIVDLKTVAQIGNRAVLLHLTLDAVVKELIKLGGKYAQRTNLRQILLITRQWRDACQTGMRRVMVDRFKPGPQPSIEVSQIGDTVEVKFTQKLVAEGTMPAFELALAFGRIRPTVNEVNAQPHTNALQGIGAIGRTIVDDEFDRQAPPQQRLLEHALNIQRRFAQTKRAVGDEP